MHPRTTTTQPRAAQPAARMYTNAGFVSDCLDGTGENASTHNEISCAAHAPPRGSPIWRRQGWRTYTGPRGCSRCQWQAAEDARARQAAPAPAAETPRQYQTAPNGQAQLIGQDEGGFRLVSAVLAPPPPSLAQREAAEKAKREHLARMGDLFAEVAP